MKQKYRDLESFNRATDDLLYILIDIGYVCRLFGLMHWQAVAPQCPF